MADNNRFSALSPPTSSPPAKAAGSKAINGPSRAALKRQRRKVSKKAKAAANEDIKNAAFLGKTTSPTSSDAGQAQSPTSSTPDAKKPTDTMPKTPVTPSHSPKIIRIMNTVSSTKKAIVPSPTGTKTVPIKTSSSSSPTLSYSAAAKAGSPPVSPPMSSLPMKPSYKLYTPRSSADLSAGPKSPSTQCPTSVSDAKKSRKAKAKPTVDGEGWTMIPKAAKDESAVTGSPGSRSSPSSDSEKKSTNARAQLLNAKKPAPNFGSSKLSTKGKGAAPNTPIDHNFPALSENTSPKIGSMPSVSYAAKAKSPPTYRKTSSAYKATTTSSTTQHISPNQKASSVEIGVKQASPKVPATNNFPDTLKSAPPTSAQFPKASYSSAAKASPNATTAVPFTASKQKESQGPCITINIGPQAIHGISKRAAMALSRTLRENFTADPNTASTQFPTGHMSKDAIRTLLVDFPKQLSDPTLPTKVGFSGSFRKDVAVLRASRFLGMEKHTRDILSQYVDYLKSALPSYEEIEIVAKMATSDKDPMYTAMVNRLCHWRYTKGIPDPEEFEKFLDKNSKLKASIDSANEYFKNRSQAGVK